MKIRKQILIPLLLVDAIALYFFLTTIEAWIFWLAALILAGSLWWLKKAIQGQRGWDKIVLNHKKARDFQLWNSSFLISSRSLIVF